MDKQLNEAVIQRITGYLPDGVKPLEYFMKFLDISKEASYRRLRGEIAFSFDELVKLAQELNFSIDNVLDEHSNDRIVVDLNTTVDADVETGFINAIKGNCGSLKQARHSKQGELMALINRPGLFFLVRFEYLFKLYYYKWMLHTYSPIDRHFSDVVMTPAILDAGFRFRAIENSLYRCSYIINRNLFEPIVREIYYLYSLNLISDEDLLLLKAELIKLLDYISILMQRGHSPSGCAFDFYLSILNVETNVAYASFNEEYVSQYWFSSVNPVYIYHPDSCAMNKKWMEAMKKFTVLISQSNEALQAKFVKEQRAYIEEITHAIH
ncbi:MAG: hypothetical protein LBV57_01050 [Candidatus Symbiothrix sp.]|jgi:hypothetical protein|nr:hypothetical protein [Candidatus Symbiothrix sp.]